MLTTVIPTFDTASLNGIRHIFKVSGGQRQRFYYWKMQPREEDKPAKKGPSPKLRGHPRDSPSVRISKSLSWLLRHGAEKAGLNIRQDGYAKVSDVVSLQRWRLAGRLSSPFQAALQPHVYRCHIHASARSRETRPKVAIPSSV